MSTVEEVVSYLETTAATIAKLSIPEVSGGAAVADGLLKVIQSAINAHQTIIGEPIDLDKLEWIDPNF